MGITPQKTRRKPPLHLGGRPSQRPGDDLSFSHDTVKMRFMTHRSLNFLRFVRNTGTYKRQKPQRPTPFPG
ncbi:hypothetical protein AK972_1468 [Pseudomonas yamanorum]|nr:hypothetical protein AK972_1468 [Pseudomonas yamanorum]